MSAPTTNSIDEREHNRTRHKWFPILILVLLAAWLLQKAIHAWYFTFYHFIAVMLSAILISAWYLTYGRAQRRTRRAIVGSLLLVLLSAWALFRPVWNGDMGFFGWRFRFAPDADELLKPLESSRTASDWQTMSRDYPRFLGDGYWAEVKGVDLDPDWQTNTPQEVWRREIGGGWSAFAIVGNYAVTQEQRGEQELVSCYRLDTGEPVWTHADNARFDPGGSGSLGDIGPRATPTIVGDKIFTQGGTGIVNCLDAHTGKVLWSHDTALKFDSPVALWGKAGSPLIIDDMAIISIGAPAITSPPAGEAASAAGSAARTAPSNSSLVAFDVITGAVRWTAGNRKASYASPVVATLAGERQIIVVNESWLTAHRASDGKVLWEYPWANEFDRDASCAQPVPLDGDRVFISKGYSVGGACLLAIKHDATGKFIAEPLWDPPIKKVMKTKLCNIVLRDGFIYGLDDVLLECIELETGAIQWKKRRQPVFGHGQIMLIGNHILVLSEAGELALVEATPEEYREVASMQVLDDANVTWNNPAFSSPYLLVRNAREAACYRMPLKQTNP